MLFQACVPKKLLQASIGEMADFPDSFRNGINDFLKLMILLIQKQMQRVKITSFYILVKF